MAGMPVVVELLVPVLVPVLGVVILRVLVVVAVFVAVPVEIIRVVPGESPVSAGPVWVAPDRPDRREIINLRYPFVTSLIRVQFQPPRPIPG